MSRQGIKGEFERAESGRGNIPEQVGWSDYWKKEQSYLEHYKLQRLEEKRGFREDRYVEEKFYVRTCGKRGKVEFYPDGSKKYVPSYCGKRGICLDCHLRYKNRQRFKEENRILAIAAATGVEKILFPTFTLPEALSSYIWAGFDTVGGKFLNELSALAVKTLKQLLGVDSRWGNGACGIISSVHLIGKGNPFKPHVHFHLACLPLHVAKDGTFEILPFWFDKVEARRLWLENLTKFCFKYGIDVEIKEVNLKLTYVSTAKIATLRHRLRYIFRSLTDDVFKSVIQIKDDFTKFSWATGNMNIYSPLVANIKLLENTLKILMNPPTRLVKPYGYFVNLKKYAAVFGLRQVEYGPDDEPVKALPCEFKRYYNTATWGGRVAQPGKFVLFAKYKGTGWHPLAKEFVVGEFCSGPKIKRWVPKQEGDKWNYWDPP